MGGWLVSLLLGEELFWGVTGVMGAKEGKQVGISLKPWISLIISKKLMPSSLKEKSGFRIH